jgi:tRNA1(Val) A37 N6-methylase TrmN6
VTRDAFLGGRLAVSQPRNGFRAGLDSVLLGAAVAAGSTSLLDLGAGVGTAALVALADRPELGATLCETDTVSAELARRNIADNGFGERAVVLGLDVATSGSARAEAGLAADAFSSVIANPPFFDPTAGTSPHPARAAARHMPVDALDVWLRAAASHAAPGGEAIVIHVAAALPALLAAFDRRFGAITVLPLCPRDGAAASRILVRGIKGSRAPFTLLASRALHVEDGRAFRPEFDALFRGEGRLVW